MKIGWCVNQYGSDAQHKADCARVAMMNPGAPIRVDAVNDNMAIENPVISQTFTIPNGASEVTVAVTSLVLPSPFLVTFRGPCHVPRVINHSIGSSTARPYVAWVGTLADSHDVVELNGKSRTARRCQDTTADPQIWEDVTDEISSGSTWFDFKVGSNAIEINRDSSTGGSVNTVAHRNPAVVFNWGWLDGRVSNIRAVGSKPMFVTIYYTPGDLRAQYDNPAVLDQHAEFIRQLVKRYKGSAWGIEADNEPNIYYTRPEGADPTLMAKVCNRIMPLIPSTWKRVSPGLGPAADDPPRQMRSLDYLREFWPLAGHNFDYVGLHPYGRVQDIAEDWSLLGDVQEIYALCGKPICATEYNYPVDTHADDTDDLATARGVADTLPYMHLVTGGDGKKVIAWCFPYAMSDPLSENDDGWDPHYGFYRTNGTARPVLDKFKYWLKHKSDLTPP